MQLHPVILDYDAVTGKQNVALPVNWAELY